MAIEFTDRYQALGIPYPDPATVCNGDCEGTGMVPICADEEDPMYNRLWAEAEAKTPNDDGWHSCRVRRATARARRSNNDRQDANRQDHYRGHDDACRLGRAGRLWFNAADHCYPPLPRQLPCAGLSARASYRDALSAHEAHDRLPHVHLLTRGGAVLIYDLIIDAHHEGIQEVFGEARHLAALTRHTVIVRGNDVSVAVAPTMTDAMCQAAYEGALAARYGAGSGPVNIIINGQRMFVTKERLSYADVVSLAGLLHDTTPTVTYGHGRDGAAGSVVPGESVAVSDGMFLVAVVTNNT